MDGERRFLQPIGTIGFDAVLDRMPRGFIQGLSQGKHSRVLPRPLRMAYRPLRRLLSGDVHFPAHIGSTATVAFFAVTLLYGAVAGGHMPQVFSITTSTAGLSTDQLSIEGTLHTTNGEIAGALKLSEDRSLMGISASGARKSVEALPWVETATIVKNYPNSLQVKIKERQAFAIWKNGGAFFVIEKNGDVIAPVNDDEAFHHLPLILGDGAAKKAAEFLTELYSQPVMAMQVEQISRIAGKRWDLQLINGVRVMLPEDKPLEAVAFIEAMDRDSRLLDRDIIAIDMRVPDRMALRLSPEAAEEHQQLVDARKRAQKRLEEGFSL